MKSEMGVGAIVNLQSNDAAKLWNMPLYLHIVWNGPFQVPALAWLVGWFAGWLDRYDWVMMGFVVLLTAHAAMGTHCTRHTTFLCTCRNICHLASR